jgi:gamma-glutamylcyclotransferase
MILVFSYGSNMLTSRLKTRAPSAQPLGTAFLERFALRWNKRSQDGSGKCSIEETGRRDDLAWGVIYELSIADKKQLDEFDGLGRGYGERRVTVVAQGKALHVAAYSACASSALTASST